MKKLVLAAMMAASAFISGEAAQAAAPAKTIASVNLRAGPGTNYPVVAAMPSAANLTLYGCNAKTTWCDVRWGSQRGWVSANYVTVVYRGASVVVTPAIVPAASITVVGYSQAYWNTYYVGRPWYGQWTYYSGQPAPTIQGRSGCVGSACGSGRVTTGAYGGKRTVARGCGPNRCGRAAVTRSPNGEVFIRRGSVSRY